jgi:hypothetical protein
MTAVRLLRCPSAVALSDALLSQALEACRLDPGGVLFLAPHPRAVADLRARLAASTRGVCGLRLLTFAELAQRILEDAQRTGTLSAAQRRLLVEETVADLLSQGELQHFGPVGETGGFLDRFAAFVAELQRHGVSPAAFARTVYRKNPPHPPAPSPRAHAESEIDDGRGGVRQKKDAIGRKERECARLYARYQRSLRRLRLHDGDAREALAAAALREGLPITLDGVRHVFVAGFLDFTPAQQAMLAALSRHVEEVAVGLLDEDGDERAALFARPRRTAATFAQAEQQTHSAGWDTLPAGLAHLARQLFRPLRRVEQSDDAAGIEAIEAPGALGEVRLVARRIRSLLLDGVRPSQVVVCARDLSPYEDLLSDTFAQYAVPLDLDGGEPLTRLAGVSLLLKAVRLPGDDHPFAGVTALLRHTFFRPDWAEVSEPDLPQKAEVLLRMLAEPRGREAYLAAAARTTWRSCAGRSSNASSACGTTRLNAPYSRTTSPGCADFLKRRESAASVWKTNATAPAWRLCSPRSRPGSGGTNRRITSPSMRGRSIADSPPWREDRSCRGRAKASAPSPRRSPGTSAPITSSC